GVSTLADLRVAGATSPLARRLGVAADHKGLKTLVAQARLSFLGTDPATNARLIDRGFTNLMSVARAADGAVVDALAPVVGFEEARRMRATAKAQSALTDNGRAQMLAAGANGKVPKATQISSPLNPSDPPACGCDDCAAAVSPLAYLADLIGYAT